MSALPTCMATAAYMSELPAHEALGFLTAICAILIGWDEHKADFRTAIFVKAETSKRPLPIEVKAEILDVEIIELRSFVEATAPLLQDVMSSREKDAVWRALGFPRDMSRSY